MRKSYSTSNLRIVHGAHTQGDHDMDLLLLLELGYGLSLSPLHSAACAVPNFNKIVRHNRNEKYILHLQVMLES